MIAIIWQCLKHAPEVIRLIVTIVRIINLLEDEAQKKLLWKSLDSAARKAREAGDTSELESILKAICNHSR